MQPRVRIRQTLQVLAAWFQAPDDVPAHDHLRPPEYALFRRMSRADKAHHLRVYHDLCAEGHTHPALLSAALLHDVGKTRYRFMLPHKIAVVVVKALWLGRFAAWSQRQPGGWETPFILSAQHPQWGADICAAVGSDPLCVELIQRHQEPPPQSPQTEADRLLLALQAADDRN